MPSTGQPGLEQRADRCEPGASGQIQHRVGGIRIGDERAVRTGQQRLAAGFDLMKPG